MHKDWRTFEEYFVSSGLGPPRFGENPPFRVQKEISLYLCKYKPKFLVLSI